MKRKQISFSIPLPTFNTSNRITTLRSWLPTRGNVLFTLIIAIFLWSQGVGATTLAPVVSSTGSINTIPYQGRLADASGTPLTNVVNMEFRLYTASAGSSSIWSELWTGSNGVQVSDGLFNVMLGSLTPIPQHVITANTSLWLGITVGTDNEMTPRVQLGTVPYAVQSLTVSDGSITTAKLVDTSVITAKLADTSVTAAKLADGSVNTAKLADTSVTTTKLADGSVTGSKLSRRMTKTVAANNVSMPNAFVHYDILSLSITLDRETLISIDSSAAFYNPDTDTLFQGFLFVDGVEITHGDNWMKTGFGEQIILSTSIILPAGTHQITLKGSSWSPNGLATGDNRTQLIVIEG